jgi:arylsulfatase A-like enzyme
MRYAKLFAGASLALAGALVLHACSRVEAPPERIVLILVDTLRADHLAPYGGQLSTPHIAALAERGQIFTSVVSSFHQTTMSMASLFTGRTPSLESGSREAPLVWSGPTWCGMRRFASEEGEPCIPRALPTLAEKLRGAGYWTVAAVTNPYLFGSQGYQRGFGRWREVRRWNERSPRVGRFDPALRSAPHVNAAAAELVRRRPTDRFFLYVHYMDVHDYEQVEVSYAEAVTRVDEAVGELVEMLRAEELLAGSVVILHSDHGERLGEPHLVEGRARHHGNPSFEEVLRVPLIVAPSPGADPDRPMRSDDVHRMILALAGIAEPPARDLAPGELFLTELGYQTYRDGTFKSYRARDGSALRLVDLRSDPEETRDVAGRHPDVAVMHARRMDELETLLAAPNVAPRGLNEEEAELLRSLGYLDE